MPTSHKKRRARERPIRRIREAARHDLDLVQRERRRRLDPALVNRLTGEATMLADPYRYRGIDAALPAQRGDLRREFFRRRVDGEGNDPAGLERLARAIAPTPDHDAPSATLPVGHTDRPVSYNAALQSFRSQRDRLGRPRR